MSMEKDFQNLIDRTKYKIKYLILIPIYNEEKKIVKFIEQLKKANYPFLIIDDGSTDNTWKQLQNHSINYLSYPRNKGKGHAIRLAHSLSYYTSVDYYLIMDGDGQHSILDIPIFLKCAEKYPKAKIIIGNRLHNASKMPLIRYLTNVFMSKVISL